MTSFKKFFTAPIFDDEIKTQQAYMLHIILWTLVCVPIPFVIYALLINPEKLYRTLVQVAFAETVNIILLVMLNRGYVKAASIIQVSAFWFFFTVTAITGNGVQSEAYLLGYSLVIAFAGILLGGIGAAVFTILSLASGVWMVYQQMQGISTFSFDNSPFTTWVVSLVLFPVGAILQYLASRTTRISMSRAQASEEKYRLISEVSSDYIFVTEVHKDGSASLSWVAGAFEKMTGYTYEEYVASGSWDGHVHPDDHEKDAQDMEKLFANQNIMNSDIRTFTKNGEIRWERIFAHPVWSEKENRLIRIVGAVQDITKQKQAEDALRESEAIYRQAIELAGAVPYHQTFEENGNIHYDFMSEGIRQITGYGPEEFNDTLWGSLIQERHLLEELAEYSLDDAIQSVRSGKYPIWKCEHCIKARDGKIHWVFEAAVDLRDENGIAHGSIGLYQDITERKQSEEALKYERDLLQIFMDNIPDQVYLKDTELRFVRINQAQARFLRVNDPQDAIGKTDLDFQNPELAREFLLEEKQILETGQPIWDRLEFNPTEDGEPRWLSTTKVPAKNNLGQIIGTIGMSRNITELKKVEELEQNRRTMLEKVVKLGQNVTEVHDLRTTLERIWRGVHDDLGFDRLGIYLYNPGRNSMDGTFGTSIHGDLIDEWHTWVSLEQENLEAGLFLRLLETPNRTYLTHTYENDFNIPEGHIMSGVKDFAAIAASAGEKPVAVLCVDHVITGRPISEVQLEALRLFAGYAGLAIENARLNTALQNELSQHKETLLHQSAILNSIPDMAWLKDKNGQYVAVNEQFSKTAGWEIENIVGKTDFEIWDIEFADKYHKDDLEVMASGQRKHDEEPQIDSTGRRYWVEITKTPILNMAGEVVGTVGIAREITERKKAELERETLITELEAKNAELERYTYTVSHDLKSPLVTIRGFLGYLEKDALAGNTQKVKDDVKRIENATQKMNTLLNDLLELSRIGRLINESTDMLFTDIAKDAISLVQGQIEARNVLVEIHNTPAIIRGDRTRLTEVIQNLVDNAVKFMGDQPSPHITIGATENEQNETVFFVRDNGVGIDSQYHDRIFTLFNKLNAGAEGTGIGLTLVKRIIEVHKGRIWLESEPGKGTIFYFTLP